MRIPDGAEAYTCVAGSLSDSYIFGFDVSFYKTYGTVCFRCYAVNMGAQQQATGYVNLQVPRLETTSRT